MTASFLPGRGWRLFSTTTTTPTVLFDTCPQLELVRFADDQLKFGVYLFIHGTIKLVRHMNTTFALSKSESLLFTAKQPLEKYTSDNFF